jgi:hypothetical protein
MRPKTVFVRPAAGARVRLPGSDFALLPDEGMELPRDQFILRRIADGDVIEGNKPKATAKASAAPAAKEA